MLDRKTLNIKTDRVNLITFVMKLYKSKMFFLFEFMTEISSHRECFILSCTF